MSSSTKSKHTTSAFIWSRILGTPFWAMLSTLPILLYKELHASPLIITLAIALKPISALLATYWSCYFCRTEKLLVPNLVLTNILRFLPFLFLFLTDSPWFILLGFTLYMTLSRGAMPAWMEIFKSHIVGEAQSKVVALGNAIEYIGMTILPLFLGIILDIDSHMWKLLFVISAFLGMLSTFFLMRIPTPEGEAIPTPTKNLLLPWKRALELLRTQPTFLRYLAGFMIGGAGLMIIQPVLPAFFVDELKLSYTEMSLALVVCKGIAYSLSSPFWSSLFKKINLFTFSALVTLLAVLFPLLLFAAGISPLFVFVAYLAYGFMQAGSELSWHMAPVAFAREGRSLAFSETNLLAVGVRGCIVPFIGSLIALPFGSMGVMLVSAALCAAATVLLYQYRTRSQSI